MAIRYGKLQKLLIFALLVTGIIEMYFHRRRSLSFEKIDQNWIISVAGVQPPNTTLNLISTTKLESKFLKVPKNLNLSCWLNPCQDKHHMVDAKMIFVIKSAVRRGNAREILRRTWTKLSYVAGFQFSSVFVLGRTDLARQALIDEEYHRYGDILQLNIPDKYRFIAEKTLGGMKWAIENFLDDVFYTSCDDDFMIDISELVKVMQWHQSKVKTELWDEFPILCSYKARLNDRPHRKYGSKYYVSRKEYRWPFYPDYCLGGAYTTSIGVARQLWQASQEVKPLKMDDVWITGILRERIGMPRQYIRKLDVSLATHHHGFSKIAGQSKREQMHKEWINLQKKFENLTSCICSVL